MTGPGGGVLLVIGVHREERAFGEGVAGFLAEQGEPPGLDVLRISDGLSGRRPRPDQRFRYEVQHRALYGQIRERAERYAVLVDLHRGEDDAGPCADVICADPAFLSCVGAGPAPRAAGARVRPVRLGSPREGGALPGARTVVPEEVWASERFLFVELEVYLAGEGAGRRSDWSFGAAVVRDVVRCAAQRRPATEA